MSKDRAAPFSRKHRKYWLPVTGGMILIGAINVAIGYCSYDPPKEAPQRIEPVLPPPRLVREALQRLGDAGVDGPAAGSAGSAAPAPGPSPGPSPAPPTPAR